jgi:hypothetical protein
LRVLIIGASIVSQSRSVWGRIEKACINGAETDVKIDTGALRSSIHAKDVVLSNLAPATVKFKFSGETIEAPIIKTRNVFNAHGSFRRVIIMLKMKIGSKEIESEFTLSDRSAMEYKVLVGRESIPQSVLINPAERHLQELEC